MQPRSPRLLRVLERLALVLSFVAGVAVFLLAFLIVVDILARRLFLVSVQGTDELGGYVLAMVGSLGLAHVLAHRGFTRIDVLFRLFPAKLSAALHALAYLTLAGMAIFFASHAIFEFRETWLFETRANTPLQTPLWIPQGLWVLGMSVFAVSAMLHGARAVLLLCAAPERVDAAYGFLALKDELEELHLVDTGPKSGRSKSGRSNG